jgi:hypothetical protein
MNKLLNDDKVFMTLQGRRHTDEQCHLANSNREKRAQAPVVDRGALDA